MVNYISLLVNSLMVVALSFVMVFITPNDVSGHTAVLAGYIGDGNNNYCTNTFFEFKDPNDTNNTYIAMSDDDDASFGGEMKLSLMEKAFYKELFGRLFGSREIYSRDSYMNDTGTMPTLKDRAYYKLLNDFRIGRWTHHYDSKSMKNYIAQDIN